MRRFCVVTVLFLLVLGCFGCGAREDVLAQFQGGYAAEVTGELYGMAFSACIEMAAPDKEGVRQATVIFYAPDALAGTTVVRDATGGVTVSAGGLSLRDAGGVGAALFSLFPVAGEITEVALTEEGYTRVCGQGFVLTLRADSTPYTIETAAVSATVVRWERK